MRNTLPTRSFGVELEIVGLAQYEAVRVLRRAGINAVDEEDYNSNGGCDCDKCRENGDWDPDYESEGPDYTSQWVCKYDSSVYGHENGSCEVTTRILSGEEGLAELRKGCEALRAAGATVNETCGLHVHIGARDLSSREIVSVVKRYGRFEHQIDSFMHFRRRGNANNYCQPVVGYASEADSWLDRRIQRAGGDESRVSHDAIRSWIADRYHKVNVQSLDEYGTIEFRHHNGAIKADTVCSWVSFLLHFVERARKVAKPGNRCRDRQVFTGLPKNIEAFYVRRQTHLNEAQSPSAWE